MDLLPFGSIHVSANKPQSLIHSRADGWIDQGRKGCPGGQFQPMDTILERKIRRCFESQTMGCPPMLEEESLRPIFALSFLKRRCNQPVACRAPIDPGCALNGNMPLNGLENASTQDGVEAASINSKIESMGLPVLMQEKSHIKRVP